MTADDDYRRLRATMEDDAERQAAAGEYRQPGAPRLAAVTVTVSAYPSAAAAFYACKARTISGTEAEGSVGTEVSDPGIFYAYNLGNAVPPTGSRVECLYVPNRWVFTFGSPRAS